jgi:hypothetical protein
MSKDDNCGQRNIQVPIPIADENIAPTLVINDGVCNTGINVQLDDVFAQVLLSYQNDPAALHRYSYYLLMQAKDFAQNEGVTEGAEIVNLAQEE